MADASVSIVYQTLLQPYLDREELRGALRRTGRAQRPADGACTGREELQSKLTAPSVPY